MLVSLLVTAFDNKTASMMPFMMTAARLFNSLQLWNGWSDKNQQNTFD
jgi:hypothetical protein